MSFLTSFELGIIVNSLVFVFTLLFSQKIKDFLAGVPADLRRGLKGVEAKVIADVKDYQTTVIAKIAPPVLKPIIPEIVIPTKA